VLAVSGLLALHYTLAAHSLIQENPTVDEVLHLPAGVSYWQKGSFRIYHHNPPLVKLVAALPVVCAQPVVEPLYQGDSWRSADFSHIFFGSQFARYNASRYFELFRSARLMVPLFSLAGGLAVFAWSRRLYGVGGGLLSLALWVFCPNILAHGRLVTSDLGATALGVVATYCFWRFLRDGGWLPAVVAGIALGMAQLTKFSMLLLYAVWPFLWLVRVIVIVPERGRLREILGGILHGIVILACSVLTVDAGYLFEGVGVPLGAFEFGSRALTRPVPPGTRRPQSKNPLFDIAWRFRINRFRGTWLGRLPTPLPEQYVIGFDEQKLETEGIPQRFSDAWQLERHQPGAMARELLRPESSDDRSTGYPVYLDGELRRSGWWYYYLLALSYKVPEGTWLLVILSIGVLIGAKRSKADWAAEVAVLAVPAVVLVSISLFTDINLGLRYVLPIAPYVYVATGKIVPWALSLPVFRRRFVGAVVAVSLGMTVAATGSIHPHYLAYFNWASGGPDREPARLIDSNLDWGQDLIRLHEWYQTNIPGQRLGLAYFGQINPSIFNVRGTPFRWFVPPARGTFRAMLQRNLPLVGPAEHLTPGYYAISATLLYGLPWRYYDPVALDRVPEAWMAAWDIKDDRAYSYFRRFKPIGPPIGHSIYIYHLSEQDVARATAMLAP
jgi:4-amino-4-deoxy-L-arabinose transferase-like glycosyltransferase